MEKEKNENTEGSEFVRDSNIYLNYVYSGVKDAPPGVLVTLPQRPSPFQTPLPVSKTPSALSETYLRNWRLHSPQGAVNVIGLPARHMFASV